MNARLHRHRPGNATPLAPAPAPLTAPGATPAPAPAQRQSADTLVREEAVGREMERGQDSQREAGVGHSFERMALFAASAAGAGATPPPGDGSSPLSLGGGADGDTSEDIGRRIEARRGLGSPMDTAARRHLEPGLGADLGAVRVHTDGEADRLARSVDAVAFTTGPDIFFRSGAYSPHTQDGMHLLAHETVHTIQQSTGPMSGTSTAGGVAVSHPSDPFEQEAEQVSAQLMRREVPAPEAKPSAGGSRPTLQRACAACEAAAAEGKQQCPTCRQEEQGLARQAKGAPGSAAQDVAPAVEGVLGSGGGQPLDRETRGFLEPRFGHDFSQVRIHTDARAEESAEAVSARAYTVGQDVVFGTGQYAPGTGAGRRLLAHELTHVVQQAPSPARLARKESPLSPPLPAAAPSTSAEPAVAPAKKEAPAGELKGANQTNPAETITAGPATAAEATSGTTAEAAATPANVPGTATAGPPAETTGGSPKSAGGGTASESPSAGAAARAGGTSGSGAAAPAVPQLDTGSSAGLLQSLATAPASAFGEALTMARTAATQLQVREKSDLETSFPEIERPTGLPRAGEAGKPAAIPLAPGTAPEPPSAGGRAGEEPETRHEEAQGPVPGSQVSTAAAEPAQEEGSWWNWLVNRLRSFFGALPTHDSGLSTSAGPRSRVDLTGEANPAQNAQIQQASDPEVAARRAQADAATTANFGENQIYPTAPAETLRPSYKPTSPATAAGGEAGTPPVLPEDARAEFDLSAAPWVSTHVNEQSASYHQEEAIYHKTVQETQEEGQRRIHEETEQVRAEQETMRQQARGDVAAERMRWQEENRKTQESYGSKASAKRQEVNQQIQDKVRDTHQEADQKLSDAEHQSETERVKAETKVADKKREEENKPRSWWDRVKGAVSDVFDGIRGFVNGVFDGLRKLVKGIIEAAKAVVRGLVEAARAAIVGLIKGFGAFIKGLVSLALIAFPETAARARAWIDNRVDGATAAVNDAAERLKKASDAALNFVARTLDAALSVLQGAFNLSLDALEFLAKIGIKAAELLAKLVELLTDWGGFLDMAKKIMDDPGVIIDGIKAAIGDMISSAPALAYSAIEGVVSPGATPQQQPAREPSGDTVTVSRDADTAAPQVASQEGALSGILRHLEPKIQYLKDHWWEELKKTGWNLLWPWPAVWGDLKEVWANTKTTFSNIYHLEISAATDSFLKIVQGLNSIAGNLYGWFFIASVLVGTIIGAFFGGAGAIPGALAGAAFAGEVGEGLVIALAATETAVIAKSALDLSLGNNTEDQDEQDYESIAGSAVTLGITGALMLIGAIAAKLAKAVINGARGLFKGKAPEVKVGAPEVKPGEVKPGEVKPGEVTPGEAKPGEVAPGETTPGEAKPGKTTPGEKPVTEGPTADGKGKVEITPDNRVIVCRACADLDIKYRNELEETGLRGQFEEAKKIADPEAQLAKMREIEQQLENKRQGTKAGETLDTKLNNLDQIKNEARGALEEAKKRFSADDLGEMRADPTAKKELQALEAKIDALKRELEPKVQEAEGLKDVAKDPSMADEVKTEADRLHEEIDDIRAKAEQIKRDVDAKVQPAGKGVPAELVDKATHISPAEYSRGKHWQGITEAERQMNSANGGPGQFKADMTAEGVKALERETLLNPDILDKRGETGYHAFKTFDQQIGWAEGQPSYTLRAELSGGSIHSHPR